MNQKNYIFSILLILITLSQKFQTQAVTDGLIHYYPFHKNLNNYIESNCAGFGYKLKTSEDRQGNPHSALQFLDNNTIDKLELPSKTLNNLSSFTITFWLKFQKLSTRTAFLSGANSGNFNEFFFNHENLQIKGASWDFDSDKKIDQLNQWMHISLSRNSVNGDVVLFKNGQILGSTTGFNTQALDTDRVFFGNEQDSLGGNFHIDHQLIGSFSELRIYNKIKTQPEMDQIYNHIITTTHEPVTEGLKHFYPFRKDLKDVIGSAHAFDYTPIFAPDRHGKPGKAMKFNNVNTVQTLEIPSSTMDNLNSFTVSFWVYNVKFATSQSCFFSVASTTNSNELMIVDHKTSFKTGSQLTVSYDNRMDQINKWYHLAVTRNEAASYIEVYIDGVLQKGQKVKNGAVQADRIFFGNDQDSLGGNFAVSNQFFGSFQDLRIYDQVKSKLEIEAIIEETYCLDDDTEYLDESEALKCINCSYPCDKCKSQTLCVDCASTDYRNSNTQCQCNDTYFDNDIECLPCQYPCENCQTTATTCQSCKGNLPNRNNDTTCSCVNGYYDKETTGVYNCVQCPKRFAICTDENTGTQCKGSNREDHTQGCVCSNGFYESTNPLQDDCLICVYPCENCNSETECTSCKTLPQRDNNTDCGCLDPYYDNDTECTICVYPCLNCESETVCKTCKGNLPNRKTDNTCKCEKGYYDFETTTNVFDCTQCHKRYSDCSAENNGTECQGLNRENASLQCICLVGYYEDPILTNIDCLQCSFKCGTCSTNSSSCDTCANALRLDTRNCGCQDEYYSEGTNPICQPCVHPCVNCQSSTHCDSCIPGANRNAFPSCTCPDDHYEKADLVDPSILNCEQCPIRCTSCNNENTCQTCKSGPNRLDLSQDCQCEPGFYENNGSCEKCDNSICATCSGSATNCTLECNSSCNRCNNLGECTSCKLGQYISENTCENCNEKCSLCDQNDKNTCILCNTEAENRSTDIDSNCQCLEGYYASEAEIHCQKCPVHNCKSCNNEGICQECISSSLLPPNCEQQKKGFFIVNPDDEASLPQKCDTKCAFCESSPDNCTQCVQAPNRSLAFPTCECLPGFHDNEGQLKDCKPCPKDCEICLNDNECLQCDQNSEKVLNYFSRLCECQKGFKLDIDTSLCVRCFEYNGECLVICPQHTILNDKTFTCDNKSFYIQDNIYLMWICTIAILLVLIFLNTLLVLQYSQRKMNQSNNNSNMKIVNQQQEQNISN